MTTSVSGSMLPLPTQVFGYALSTAMNRLQGPACEAREAFSAARSWISRKVLKDAIEAAVADRNGEALEAAACLKQSFAMDGAPLLLKMMTAESALGEALRGSYRLLHSTSRAIRSPLRRYMHRRHLRSVTTALAL